MSVREFLRDLILTSTSLIWFCVYDAEILGNHMNCNLLYSLDIRIRYVLLVDFIRQPLIILTDSLEVSRQVHVVRLFFP